MFPNFAFLRPSPIDFFALRRLEFVVSRGNIGEADARNLSLLFWAVAATARNINDLSIKYYHKTPLFADEISELVNIQTDLAKISFHSNTNLPDNLIAVLGTQSDSLNSIHINCRDISALDLSPLSSCHQLETIHVENMSGLPPTVWAPLDTGSHRIKNIASLSNGTSLATLMTLPLIRIAGHHLQSLTLKERQLTEINDIISKHNPNITHLTVWLDIYNFGTLCNILRNLNQLTELTLRCYDGETLIPLHLGPLFESFSPSLRCFNTQYWFNKIGLTYLLETSPGHVTTFGFYSFFDLTQELFSTLVDFALMRAGTEKVSFGFEELLFERVDMARLNEVANTYLLKKLIE